MRIIALALIVLGVVALAYGGISYKRNRTVFEVGSIEATVTEQKKVPVSPIVGVLCLAGGVWLLLADKRRVV